MIHTVSLALLCSIQTLVNELIPKCGLAIKDCCTALSLLHSEEQIYFRITVTTGVFWMSMALYGNEIEQMSTEIKVKHL